MFPGYTDRGFRCCHYCYRCLGLPSSILMPTSVFLRVSFGFFNQNAIRTPELFRKYPLVAVAAAFPTLNTIITNNGTTSYIYTPLPPLALNFERGLSYECVMLQSPVCTNDLCGLLLSASHYYREPSEIR